MGKLASCWFLAWLILRSWRMKRHILPKHWNTYIRLHRLTPQEAVIFIRKVGYKESSGISEQRENNLDHKSEDMRRLCADCVFIRDRSYPSVWQLSVISSPGRRNQRRSTEVRCLDTNRLWQTETKYINHNTAHSLVHRILFLTRLPKSNYGLR
jgi:hypothetical protein